MRETGGLADSVQAYNQYTQEVTGFRCDNMNADERADGVYRGWLYERDAEAYQNKNGSWEAYRRVYTYDLNWIALKNTIITAGFTTVLGVAIAFPLAFLVGRTDMYGKKFFRTLFVVTYMVPPYVGAMAWLRLLNPNAGVLNRFLMKIFGRHLLER